MLAISGTLDRLHLGDLLEWLHLTRATGRLLLTVSDVTRAFDLSSGHIVFASSSCASERLGSWLLQRDLAPRDALLRALAVAQIRGELFTSVVERDAGVAHATLTEAGRALATTLVSRLLREEHVRFTFDPDWPVADNCHVNLGLDSRSVVMQAAYRADTDPVADSAVASQYTALDPVSIEGLFWHIVSEMEGEVVDLAGLAEAHRTFLAVGELLHRWVVQGPPLLPLGPDDAERVARRLDARKPLRLDESAAMSWNLLALVNALDAPDGARASGADEAWALAGAEAPEWARLILEHPRWCRDARAERDEPLRRATQARIAAARSLAGVVDLSEDVATTVAALPMVMLDLVATALSCSAITASVLQHRTVHHLLPLVGRAAGMAAGLPEPLLAALAVAPADHAAARLSRLIGVAAGEVMASGGVHAAPIELDERLAAAVAAARRAAERTVRARPEQR